MNKTENIYIAVLIEYLNISKIIFFESNVLFSLHLEQYYVSLEREVKFLISHNKTKKCTNINIIFFTSNISNSDILRFIFIIFMGLLNINEAYIKIDGL
jgi:hypothetical protein